MSTTVFGPAVLASDVEQGAITTLGTWFPSYLAELERNTSRPAGALQSPRSWGAYPSFFEKQGAQLPAGVVISPGLADEPIRHGDGTYLCTWRLEIAILVTASDQAAANQLGKLYARAVAMILLQKNALGGIAAGVDWVAEQYTDAPADFVPVGSIGACAFDVRVDGVVTAFGGPAAPTLNPDDYTLVETAEIAVERSLS